MEVVVITLMIVALYGICKEFAPGKRTPVQQSSPQVRVRRDGPVVVKVPVEQVVYDWSAINKQLDEYLGCVETEWMLAISRYRPRSDLHWFCTNFGATIVPSPAEQLIIDELVKYDIVWEREISFAGLQLETKGWARYDFWLPNHNTVIEYHSRVWHSTTQRTDVDKIKEQFCTDNHINLVTYNSQDYYHISARIKELMEELSVQPL